MLGGFTSIPGAIVGGLIIGVGEKLFEFAIGPIIGRATENWFAYVLALVFLVFRPQVSLATKSSKGCDGMTNTNAFLWLGPLTQFFVGRRNNVLP